MNELMEHPLIISKADRADTVPKVVVDHFMGPGAGS